MNLRVALFPADQTGCGTYRMRLPAQAAMLEEGVQVDFPHGSKRVFREIAQGARPFDVVVFQRCAHRDVVAAIPGIQRAGVAVVVDIDDDLAACHPQSQAFEELHPLRGDTRISSHHLRRACQLADLVTVSTPALAPRYGGRKARVLPNLVPESLLSLSTARDGHTIGWGGFTSTHIGDLAITRGGVAQALEGTGARFLAVGDPDGVKRELGLAEEPDSTGPVPFAEYHQTLARLDVTIAPLADSQFNRSKSALKLLEAAALGIPCVASPRPDYLRVHADGIGVIAQDRSRDWRREVRRLLTDRAWRAELAARGREAIAEHHTYEAAGWWWAEAWNEAREIRRNSRVKVAA